MFIIIYLHKNTTVQFAEKDTVEKPDNVINSKINNFFHLIRIYFLCNNLSNLVWEKIFK